MGPTQETAVDQEARDLARAALHDAALSNQAWLHHTKQCEEDRARTIQSLRDMGLAIRDVRTESQERGRRVHEKMEALRADFQTELQKLPAQFAAALAAPDEKRIFARFQIWIFGAVITVLLAFIGYLLFMPNPFVIQILPGGA